MKKSRLYDMESVELFECMENIKRDLKASNKEYKELFTKIERFKDKYPNIRGILEDERITEMTLEECKVLLETINLYRDLLKIEQYEMFLFGGREMYNYFKSVRIIDYLQKSKRCDKIYKINERIM